MAVSGRRRSRKSSDINNNNKVINMTEDWMEGIDEKQVDKAVQAGEILPPLPLPEIEPGKTSSSETLYVKFLENPQKKMSEKFLKGFAWIATVEHQGAKKQVFVPDSLRFNLAKECKLHGISEPRGHWFVIGASIVDMKPTKTRPAMKGVKLYWCQLKKNGEIEREQEPEGVPEEL